MSSMLVLMGLVVQWIGWLPNKQIWSPSYVLIMAGTNGVLLVVCLQIVFPRARTSSTCTTPIFSSVCRLFAGWYRAGADAFLSHVSLKSTPGLL